MNSARLALLFAACLTLAAGGCIERLPSRPPPEVPPYPQEKFDSPLNGWHHYARAAALLNRDLRRPEYRGGPLAPELIEEFAEYLKDQRNALAALEAAVGAPYCVVPEGDLLEDVPELGSIRELARLRTIEGRVLLDRGDLTGAVRAWLDTIEVGHDMMHEGVIICKLVGVAADNIGSAPLAAFVQEGRGEAGHYRDIIKRLTEVESHRFPHADNLVREYAMTRAYLEHETSPAKLRELMEGHPLEWDLARIEEIVDSLVVFFSKDVLVSNLDTSFSMLVEDARRPYPERDPDLLEKLATDPISGVLLPTFSRTGVTDTCDVVSLRAITLMAALQLYRLDHALLPPTLDALRPTYLPELPLDPFSEQPFRYLRLPGDRFVVYSVGPDQDDDRADVEWEWSQRQPSDGDIIFREGDVK